VSKLVLFNKPFNVLCQFTDDNGRETLADYIDIKTVYPAGRLDYDSEGLLLLTDDGQLQAQISSPKFKLPKTYWVQIEGQVSAAECKKLLAGVELKDVWPRRLAVARWMNRIYGLGFRRYANVKLSAIVGWRLLLTKVAIAKSVE
jgi:23S rRNA pseudouridine2457 synthase